MLRLPTAPRPAAPLPPTAPGHHARTRLLADKAVRPLQADRARLLVLSARFDRAARAALAPLLARRVRAQPRLADALGHLMRLSLDT